MIDPATMAAAEAAKIGEKVLKAQAANKDYIANLDLQQKQNANNINEAGARTTFGNDFLKGYGAKYGGLVDQNSANEATRLDSRMGAIQPTVSAFAAPAQEAERTGLAGQRFGAASATMGPQASSTAIPLNAGMGKGATAATYDKAFAASNAGASDIAARKSNLGSWDDIWNRNALRESETKRGTGVAEAIGKGRSDVINQGVATNTRSLSALPALQDLVGFQARGAPVNAPKPTNTSLADILGGLGNLGGAYAGSGGGLPNFSSYMPAPGGPSVVPRPTFFG